MPERYYERNKELVEAFGLLHALISQEDGFTVGTRFEVAYAVSLGIPVLLHWESGYFLRKSDERKKYRTMRDKKGQSAELTLKADAAFRQAARKVIQVALQTGTPIIVWEEGRVKKISPDQVEATRLAMEGEETRA